MICLESEHNLELNWLFFLYIRLKSLFLVLRALRELLMRGKLSRTTYSFQIESRLANWSY